MKLIIKKILKNSNLIIVILLFSSSLVTYLYLTKNFREPIITPDSTQYLAIANGILNNSDTTWLRPPTYPIFIVASKLLLNTQITNMETIYVQFVLNAFTPVLTYFICLKLFKNKYLSLIIALLSIFNLQLIGYSTTILTEGVIVPVSLSLLLIFIEYVANPKNKILILLFVAISIVAYFLKPIFLYLPFVLIIWNLLYQLMLKRLNLSTIKNSITVLIVLLIPIIVWCTFNYYERGFFGFDQVTAINRLGKYVQYGYLRNYSLSEDDDISLKRLKSNYLSGKHSVGPLIESTLDIQDAFTASTNVLEKWNSKLAQGKTMDFVKKTLRLYPSVIETTRSTNKYKGGNDSVIISVTEEIWNLSSSLSIYALLTTFSSFFVMFFTNKVNNSFFTLSTLLITYLYFTIITTVAGFSEYSRLLIPVTVINLVFVFVSINFLWEGIKFFYRNYVHSNWKIFTKE